MLRRKSHDACDAYITELIAHIHNIQDQLDEARALNHSYELWQNRAIQRVREMTNG